MDALTIVILIVIIAPLIIIVCWGITLITFGWNCIVKYTDKCIKQKFRRLENENE